MVARFFRNYGLAVLVAVGIAWYYLRYKRAADFEAPAIPVIFSGGQNGMLSDSLQLPAVVHFYASWCGPCMAELPLMAAAGPRLSEAGYHWYLVTDDNAALTDAIRQAVPRDWHVWRTSSLRDCSIYTLPTTYAIGKNGSTVYAGTGPCGWNDTSFITTLLQANH